MSRTVYNGGHLLNQAFVEFRDKQHKELLDIGVEPYSPHKDNSINDKANAVQEGLAERILKNDYGAMYNSDAYIFDIIPEATGTICELGIILGIKRQAKKTLDIIENQLHYDHPEYNNVHQIAIEVKKILDRPVYVYCSDIRQGHGKPYNDPDRAEFSTNQFVYGAILELTNGEGFITWEEIKERLVDYNEVYEK